MGTRRAIRAMFTSIPCWPGVGASLGLPIPSQAPCCPAWGGGYTMVPLYPCKSLCLCAASLLGHHIPTRGTPVGGCYPGITPGFGALIFGGTSPLPYVTPYPKTHSCSGSSLSLHPKVNPVGGGRLKFINMLLFVFCCFFYKENKASWPWTGACRACVHRQGTPQKTRDEQCKKRKRPSLKALKSTSAYPTEQPQQIHTGR